MALARVFRGTADRTPRLTAFVAGANEIFKYKTKNERTNKKWEREKEFSAERRVSAQRKHFLRGRHFNTWINICAPAAPKKEIL